MTENLEREAGIAIDIEEAEKTASEDVVAQREESLAKQLAEMKKRKSFIGQSVLRKSISCGQNREKCSESLWKLPEDVHRKFWDE